MVLSKSRYILKDFCWSISGFFSECDVEIDMVLILDASTSVTETNFKKMLQFCKDFLRTADIDSGNVRVGVLIYSSEVCIAFCCKLFNYYSIKVSLHLFRFVFRVCSCIHARVMAAGKKNY